MHPRKAHLPDAAQIQGQIPAYTAHGTLMPRTQAEICEHIRDFTVVVSKSQVIGCGALHFYGLDLAEIRSLAVACTAQQQGVGRSLVEALLAEAQEHRVARVCLFTRIPDYFAPLGFVPVPPQSLPEKIWKDCLKCPRFHRCDETALVFAGVSLPVELHRPAVSALRVLPG